MRRGRSINELRSKMFILQVHGFVKGCLDSKQKWIEMKGGIKNMELRKGREDGRKAGRQEGRKEGRKGGREKRRREGGKNQVVLSRILNDNLNIKIHNSDRAEENWTEM